MSAQNIKLLDVIALVEDVPAADVNRGDIGAIVHVYPESAAYEVEFCDKDGDTVALVTLLPHQFVVLQKHGQPIFHDLAA